MNPRQFIDWRYEKPDAPRDSAQAARVILLLMIPDLKPRTVISLFRDAFPSFLESVKTLFKKSDAVQHEIQRIKQSPSGYKSSHPEWRGLLSALREISDKEIEEIFLNWHALQRLSEATLLCDKLRTWAGAQNLNVDWFYDHAIRVLRRWVFDERCSDERRKVTLEKVGFNFMDLAFSWNAALSWIQIDLQRSRASLRHEAYTDLPPFKFRWKDFSFEIPRGWWFLDQEKGVWVALVSEEFEKALAARTIAGVSVPKSLRGRFRTALKHYLANAQEGKQRIISKYNLIKAPRRYEGHDLETGIEWLVRYQLPVCEGYKRIARRELLKKRIKNTDIDQEVIEKEAAVIGKHVHRTAEFIGIELRKRSYGPRQTKVKGIGSAGRARKEPN
ncbi:MAG TPA: hypothetical protein VE135_10305 [Pyrinomonadaceae bacterium]|nr:hypothetical protein [Pyrinomonadaceae bacterium]